MLAISDRSCGVSAFALAAAPFLPDLLRATFVAAIVALSSTSPVAIFATMIAAPITSPGRFSPLGPFGIPYPPDEPQNQERDRERPAKHRYGRGDG